MMVSAAQKATGDMQTLTRKHGTIHKNIEALYNELHDLIEEQETIEKL